MRTIIVLFLVFFVVTNVFPQEMILEFHREKKECTLVSFDKDNKRRELGTYDVVFPRSIKFLPVLGVVEQTTLVHASNGLARGEVTMKMFRSQKDFTFLYIRSVQSIRHIPRAQNTFYMERWDVQGIIKSLNGVRAKIFISK